jgi:hypothetical protein
MFPIGVMSPVGHLHREPRRSPGIADALNARDIHTARSG